MKVVKVKNPLVFPPLIQRATPILQQPKVIAPPRRYDVQLAPFIDNKTDWTREFSAPAMPLTRKANSTAIFSVKLREGSLSVEEILTFLRSKPSQAKYLEIDDIVRMYDKIELDSRWDILLKSDYHELMSCLVDTEQKGYIVQLMLKMKRNGLAADDFVYTCMFLSFPNYSLEIRKSINKDKIAISNKTVRALLYTQLRTKSNTLLQKVDFKTIWLDVSDLQLNMTTLAAFIEAFGVKKDKKMVEMVHDKLMRFKNDWTDDIYESAIRAHSEIGNIRAVKRLYEDYYEIFEFSRPRILTYYLKALEQQKSFLQVEITFKRFNRRGIVIDREGYRSLFNSFEESEKHEEIRKILKSFRQRDMGYLTLYEGMEILTRIGTLDECHSFYRYMDKARRSEIRHLNKARGMDYTTDEIISAFRNGNSGILSKFRDWISLEMPRSILATIAERVASTRSREDILELFKSDILTTQSLSLFWHKEVSTIQLRLTNMEKLTQEQLDDPSCTKRSELKANMSWIKRRLKRGALLTVGEEGPFEPIYKAMLRGWRQSTIEIQDPLIIEDLLKELTRYETETVKNFKLGLRLQGEKDNSMDLLEDKWREEVLQRNKSEIH